MAVTMQGSAISRIDVADAKVVLLTDGSYKLMIGATDMGTGCDTILAQMVASEMNCSIDAVFTDDVDTDKSPYDTGSYASSTTYLTGKSVVKACKLLKDQIFELIYNKYKIESLEIRLNGDKALTSQGEVLLKDLITHEISGFASSTTNVSPPPFVAGFVELESDPETFEIKVIDYVGVVDCGTPINPNLARIQLEGGLVQGIGMALIEDINYSSKGRMYNDSLMRYKMPTRLDFNSIRTAFESSYEPTGPYGAKSIGEVVINTPSPAIAAAVYNAFKVNVRSLPITSEKIYKRTKNKD